MDWLSKAQATIIIADRREQPACLTCRHATTIATAIKHSRSSSESLPAQMPRAADVQIVVAVVRPESWPSLPLMMVPAPRKPTPLTICAAIRAGSPDPAPAE